MRGAVAAAVPSNCQRPRRHAIHFVCCHVGVLVGAADACSSSSSSARSQAGAAGPAVCGVLDRQLATVAGNPSRHRLQPSPWPRPAASQRGLHCAVSRQHTAAMPAVAEQEQEQEETVPDAAASAALDAASAAGAAAAAALSGAAAQVALGDPFLSSLEATQGPAAAYKAGRLQGLFRKVGPACLRPAAHIRGMPAAAQNSPLSSRFSADALCYLGAPQDERQEATILQLQRVYGDLQAKLCRGHTLVKGRGLTLLDAAPEPGGGWLSGWLRGSSSSAGGDARSSASPVRGLYMYGGVGVGKTMLMDLLATTAPPFFQVASIPPRCGAAVTTRCLAAGRGWSRQPTCCTAAVEGSWLCEPPVYKPVGRLTVHSPPSPPCSSTAGAHPLPRLHAGRAPAPAPLRLPGRPAGPRGRQHRR